MRILLTTTSFQDTPGGHHELLQGTGWEIITARGPLNEADTLALVGDVDGCICGDDAITRKVLEKARPKLKVLSKYGIGVDKIDVKSCTEFGIPLLFTPGVNHTTVAEHNFLPLLALGKTFCSTPTLRGLAAGNARRATNCWTKPIGIIGLGFASARAVALRARAFGMKVLAFDNYFDAAFSQQHEVKRAGSLDEVFAASDYISRTRTSPRRPRDLVNAANIAKMKKGVLILNCARGEIVNTNDLVAALKSGQVGGYGTGRKRDQEPPPA